MSLVCAPAPARPRVSVCVCARQPVLACCGCPSLSGRCNAERGRGAAIGRKFSDEMFRFPLEAHLAAPIAQSGAHGRGSLALRDGLSTKVSCSAAHPCPPARQYAGGKTAAAWRTWVFLRRIASAVPEGRICMGPRTRYHRRRCCATGHWGRARRVWQPVEAQRNVAAQLRTHGWRRARERKRQRRREGWASGDRSRESWKERPSALAGACDVSVKLPFSAMDDMTTGGGQRAAARAASDQRNHGRQAPSSTSFIVDVCRRRRGSGSQEARLAGP